MSEESSAFSSYNIRSGPFYDPTMEPVSVERRRREDEDRRRLPDDWEEGAPVDVGKRGKDKDKERLEKRFREQEDEGEDWFNDARNVKKRGMNRQAPPPAPPRGRRLKFGTFKDESYERSSPKPSLPNNGGGSSLLARIGDAPGGRNQRKTDHDDRREPPQRFENFIRIRGAATDPRNQEDRNANPSKTDWERGQENGDKAGGRRGSRRNHGPRYKGGYDR